MPIDIIQEISKHKVTFTCMELQSNLHLSPKQLEAIQFALRVLGMMDVDKIMNIIVSYNHKIVANGQQPITEEDELAHSILTGLTSQEGEGK